MKENLTILIADSGATKTDWVAVSYSDGKKETESFSGLGISPLHHPESVIKNELLLVRESLGENFDRIRFHGAGLGTATMRDKMRDCLADVFSCPDIDAQGDMLGAAKALLGEKSGIACIMGTGSNSCYYDGEKITFQPVSMGYLLDDEGGGVAFGKRLLADVYKRLMSQEVLDRFHNKYHLSEEELIDRIYRKPAPNRWIAAFSVFLSENQDLPEVSALIDSQIERFLDREFANYSKETLTEEGVSFAGSVAHAFEGRIHQAFLRRGWKFVRVVRRPILELI